MARGRCSRNPRETNGCRDLWLSPPSRRSHTQPRPDPTAPPGWLLIISNETAKPARESAPGHAVICPTPALLTSACQQSLVRRAGGSPAVGPPPLSPSPPTHLLPQRCPLALSPKYIPNATTSHTSTTATLDGATSISDPDHRGFSLTLCSTLATRQPKSKSLLSKCQSDYVHRWLKMSMASQLTPSKIPTPF